MWKYYFNEWLAAVQHEIKHAIMRRVPFVCEL